MQVFFRYIKTNVFSILPLKIFDKGDFFISLQSVKQLHADEYSNRKGVLRNETRAVHKPKACKNHTL